MNLGSPPERYDRRDIAEARQTLAKADVLNRKKGQDIEIAGDERLILKSPNGTRFSIEVADDGILSATAL